MCIQRRRLRMKMHRRLSNDVVEPTIDVSQRAQINYFAFGKATFPADRSSNLEQVGKVRAKFNCKVQHHRHNAMIANSDALMGRFIPDEDRANNVNRVFLEYDMAINHEIRIGKIYRE